MSRKKTKALSSSLSLLLSVLMLVLTLTACTPVEDGGDGGEFVIVTTIFPVYDWVRNIVDEIPVKVELLNTSGGDMHSYDPSYADIVKMKRASLFICIGGESEKWIEDVFASADDKLLPLMDAPGVTLIENEGESDGGSHDEDCSHGHDEHIWLSLRSAMASVKEIANRLMTLLPEHKEAIAEGCEAYTARLAELDGKYESMVKSSQRGEVIFADRYPFVYMMHDYGIECISAFGGCSTDTNASFDAIVSLAKSLNEKTVDALLVCENSDGKVARAVIDASQKKNTKVLVLDSMQSIGSDYESADYISIMQLNLSVLSSALGSVGTK